MQSIHYLDFVGKNNDNVTLFCIGLKGPPSQMADSLLGWSQMANGEPLGRGPNVQMPPGFWLIWFINQRALYNHAL